MNNTKPRIVYFEPNFPAASSGVLHSTVLAEASFLSKKNYNCLFVGAEVSDEKAREAENYIEQTYGIKSHVYGCYSRKIRVLSAINTTNTVYKLSRDAIRQFKPTHIWTDTFNLSKVGRKIARENNAISVYDVQAIQAEEIALERGRGLKYFLSYNMERSELRKTDRICGVSNKIKQWVKNLTGRDDLVVIPCCMDTNSFSYNSDARLQIRKELGIADNEKVICYSGGLSIWQKIPEIIKCFDLIAGLRDDVKFLFLTRQVDELEKMISVTKQVKNRYIARSCLLKEVPGYLSAADLGIIIRDNIPVNNVASPIKIGEYLSCGLPVILTDGIGDYSDMIRETGVGVVLSGDVENYARQIVDFISTANLSSLQEKAIKVASDQVSWESNFNSLEQLFKCE